MKLFITGANGFIGGTLLPDPADVAPTLDDADVVDPRLFSRAPVQSPANPPPMTTTVTSSCTGSRSTRSM